MVDKVNSMARTFNAKVGMPVYEMQQNGNCMQKKYAHVFDADGNGIFNAQEAKLFNASSLKQEANGNLTIWTNYASGKNKITMNAKEIEFNRLGIVKLGNKEYINIVEAPANGESKVKKLEGKYNLTIGEADEPNGYCVVKDNTAKYYGKSGKLTGSIEHKNGKDYYKDANGKFLYSVRILGGYSEYYDDNDVLRYTIANDNSYGTKATVTSYIQGEFSRKYNDVVCTATVDWNPHYNFRNLEDVIRGSYSIQ